VYIQWNTYNILTVEHIHYILTVEHIQYILTVGICQAKHISADVSLLPGTLLWTHTAAPDMLPGTVGSDRPVQIHIHTLRILGTEY